VERYREYSIVTTRPSSVAVSAGRRRRTLDRLLRVDRLGRVDADQADAFDGAGELDLGR
jgi:hypothetical protein